MTNRMYKQLDRVGYTALRKRLLREKGSGDQQNLLEIAKRNDDFVGFVRSQSGVEGDKEVGIFGEVLTEGMYKEPPKDTEKEIYEMWKELTPEVACRVAFWGEVTLRHIEAGRIDACFLAANGGNLPGGAERIDKALESGSDKEIDSCVRAILRRMSGLPEARGNISVYVNCPFGCAWQRSKMAEEVAAATGKSYDSIAKLLRLKQDYWERLVRLVVSRNSVLGDRNVRDALVCVLAEKLEKDSKHAVLEPKNLERICRLLGVQCAWRELGIFAVGELKGIIDEVISSVFPPDNESDR